MTAAHDQTTLVFASAGLFLSLAAQVTPTFPAVLAVAGIAFSLSAVPRALRPIAEAASR